VAGSRRCGRPKVSAATEGGAQGAAGVSGRRLNPQSFEDFFAQDAAVGHAVEGDTAGQAEVGKSGQLPGVAGEFEEDLFGHDLGGARDVQVPLFEAGLGRARRSAEQPVEAPVGHGEGAKEPEVVHVQPERPVLLDVDQLVVNRLHKAGLTVGRQSHELVFARVDAEPAVGRKGRVEQPERMRKAQLLEDFHGVPLAAADGGRGPFAHSVDGQDGSFVEGGREERAGRVGLVMFGEEDRAIGAQTGEFVPDGLSQVQFFTEPIWEDARERGEAAGGHGEVRFQQARKFSDRFVVEDDRVELSRREPGVAEAELDGVLREALVIFAPGEAFLLSGSQDGAVLHQRGRGIMVVGGQPENVAHGRGRHHMNGYIRGASTELALKMMMAPSASRRMTSGINHHFFSCRRNSRNSLHNCHMPSLVLSAHDIGSKTGALERGDGLRPNVQRPTFNVERPTAAALEC